MKELIHGTTHAGSHVLPDSLEKGELMPRGTVNGRTHIEVRRSVLLYGGFDRWLLFLSVSSHHALTCHQT